jgi:hypothetical protein
MQNGEFSIINESNGLGHNSCWISRYDGNMWFASYGGGVSKFDKVTVFTTKPTCEQDKEGFFPLKVKCMLVLNRVFLFDIKTKW